MVGELHSGVSVFLNSHGIEIVNDFARHSENHHNAVLNLSRGITVQNKRRSKCFAEYTAKSAVGCFQTDFSNGHTILPSFEARFPVRATDEHATK
jgi:hypothetical protein